MTAPALYDAWVTHSRTQRTHRDFRHRVYLWLVDLDRLPKPPAWLRPFAEFRSSDHLGDPDRSIRANVDDYLAEQGIELAGGQVLMLANARVLGYVFNPLTVYWCHRPDGELACVVAEVHNTYGERHRYLLHPDAAGRARTDKAFYVSPFLTVEGHYDMSLRRPDDRLAVSVTLHQDGAPALAATIRGVRRPASTRELVRMVLRRPFLPHWISILIYRHGIAMWLRRYPVTPRTRSNTKSSTRHAQEATR